MGERGALGPARGARRVEEHRDVVAGGRGHLVLRLQARQFGGERGRFDRQAPYPGGGRAGRPLSRCLVPLEEQDGAGVPQVVLGLALLQERVQRHHDAAGAQDGVVQDDELGHVREHQRNAVARAQALGAQQRGGLRAQPVQFGVGGGLRPEPQRRAARQPSCRLHQELRQIGHDASSHARSPRSRGPAPRRSRGVPPPTLTAWSPGPSRGSMAAPTVHPRPSCSGGQSDSRTLRVWVCRMWPPRCVCAFRSWAS